MAAAEPMAAKREEAAPHFARKFIWVLPAVALLVTLCKVDAQQLLLDLGEAAHAYKEENPVLMAWAACALLVVWILSFLPLTPLEVSLGFLFGFKMGYVVVFLGKVLGCSASFGLGRTLARDWAQKQFGKHELLRAIDLAVAKKPYKICFIVRLAYIPIALKNWGLAVVSVSPANFFVSLFVVELFNSSILVTVGSTAKDLGALISGKEPKSAGQLWTMALGSSFLLMLLGYMSHLTKQALAEVRSDASKQQQ